MYEADAFLGLGNLDAGEYAVVTNLETGGLLEQRG